MVQKGSYLVCWNFSGVTLNKGVGGQLREQSGSVSVRA